MKNVFMGTTDEFYTKLQEFVAVLRTEGKDIAVEDQGRWMGGGGIFSISLDGREGFSIRASEDNYEDKVSFVLATRNWDREDYVNALFARLVEYMQKPIVLKVERGPRGHNRSEKRKIVERYLEIQNLVNQTDYAKQHHIVDRTLRRWIEAYSEGKL